MTKYVIVGRWLGTYSFPPFVNEITGKYYPTREEAQDRADHLQAFLVSDTAMRYEVVEIDEAKP